MITKFDCKCGNTDTSKVHEYDGAVGYEALVCKVCGTYYDHTGEHPADDFSKQFIIVEPTLRQLILKRIEEIKYTEHGFSKDLQKCSKFKSTATVHISDFNFEVCTDVELLRMFEMILRQYYKQF